jgi:hypothetical protein
MTSEEKSQLSEIRKEVSVIRLQVKAMTESEFKKALDKVVRLIDKMTGKDV